MDGARPGYRGNNQPCNLKLLQYSVLGGPRKRLWVSPYAVPNSYDFLPLLIPLSGKKVMWTSMQFNLVLQALCHGQQPTRGSGPSFVPQIKAKPTSLRAVSPPARGRSPAGGSGGTAAPREERTPPVVRWPPEAFHSGL